MTRLDRVVVLALGLAATSAGLAMHAASPGLQYLRAHVEQQQVQLLLERIAENADRFGRSLDLDPAAERSLDAPQGTDEIRQAVNDFGQAAARLRDRAGDRPSNTLDVADVQEVLRRRGRIDNFTQRHPLGADAERLWLSLHEDLARLARAHAMTRDVGAEAP